MPEQIPGSEHRHSHRKRCVNFAIIGQGTQHGIDIEQVAQTPIELGVLKQMHHRMDQLIHRVEHEVT